MTDGIDWTAVNNFLDQLKAYELTGSVVIPLAQGGTLKVFKDPQGHPQYEVAFIFRGSF